MKNIKLRTAWIIPNICMYIAFIVIGVFVLINDSALNDISRRGIWIVMMFLLLFVALFGTLRILSWIKQGKM